jgi:hypothetical protein
VCRRGWNEVKVDLDELSSSDPAPPLEMTMEVAQTVTVDYASITALLQSLASSVVQDKLNETPQDPSHTLTSAGPLFAALHAVNRSSLNSSKVSVDP